MEIKREVREEFKKEATIKKYSKGSIIEQNFGIVKHNYGLNRFRHTGIKNNTLIWNIYTIAANMSRAYSIETKKIKKEIAG